jgi:hypothetical protein
MPYVETVLSWAGFAGFAPDQRQRTIIERIDQVFGEMTRRALAPRR